MKKYIIGSMLIVLTICSAFQKQINDLVAPEKPVEKEISVSLATDRNYSARVYQNTIASVHIIVTKLRGSKETIVWEKTFDTMQLQNYPSVSYALTQHINVPLVFDKKEKLVVTYIVTYNTKGSILQITKEAIESNRAKKGNLFINI